MVIAPVKVVANLSDYSPEQKHLWLGTQNASPGKNGSSRN